MKTMTKTFSKNVLRTLLLVLSICFVNAAWAYKASFTYTTGSSGQITCTSTSTGTTANTIYYWQAGDGSNASSGTGLTTFNHTYAYNGTYSVFLQITDSLTSQTDYTFDTITITTAATCSIVASFTDSIGANGTVYFTSTSTGLPSGGVQYNWVPMDGSGNSGTSSSYVHRFVNNGTYTVYLSVTDSTGECYNDDTVNVTITNATGCGLLASFTYSIGLNGHVTFTNTSSTSGSVEYTWNPGDGSGFGNNSAYSHIYLANGTYTVSLALNEDSSTCHSSDTVVINITNVTVPCTLAASYTYSIGAHGVVSFTSTSTGTNSATQYYWNFGDGSGTNLLTSAPTHTYIIQGNYTAWLVVKDTGTAYCADSTLASLKVTTADSNSCNLKANFTYTIGLNGHVTFSNTSTGSYSSLYSVWNPGDGSGTSGPTSSLSYNHTYIANGTYYVNLLIQNANAFDSTTFHDSTVCIDSITIPITISNVTTPCTLSANFIAINDTALGEITVINTSTGTNSGTQYYWGQGPTDSSTAILGNDTMMFNYTSNGTYYIKLVVKNVDSAFCVDSITLPIYISNRDSLHASYTSTYLGDTIGLGYMYQFMSTSTGVNGNTWYLWNPGDTTAADSGIGMNYYSHNYKYPGVHTVTLSIWFASYPKIKPHGTMGYTRYDFSSYSQNIYISSPQGIATITDAAAGMNIYPTPNTGQFKMVVNNVSDGNADVEIINVLGETMYKGTMQVSNGKLQQDINLQNAPNGSYFVRVITAGKVYVGRTVISNK